MLAVARDRGFRVVTRLRLSIALTPTRLAWPCKSYRCCRSARRSRASNRVWADNRRSPRALKRTEFCLPLERSSCTSCGLCLCSPAWAWPASRRECPRAWCRSDRTARLLPGAEKSVVCHPRKNMLRRFVRQKSVAGHSSNAFVLAAAKCPPPPSAAPSPESSQVHTSTPPPPRRSSPTQEALKFAPAGPLAARSSRDDTTSFAPISHPPSIPSHHATLSPSPLRRSCCAAARP